MGGWGEDRREAVRRKEEQSGHGRSVRFYCVCGNKEPRTFLPCAPLGFERRVHCMPVHDPQLWHSTLNTLVKREGRLILVPLLSHWGAEWPILPFVTSTDSADSAGLFRRSAHFGPEWTSSTHPSSYHEPWFPCISFLRTVIMLKWNQSFEFLEPVDKWVYVQDDNQWVSFPHSKNRPTLIKTALTSV